MSEQSDLEHLLGEADHVLAMSRSKGWRIIERDLKEYLRSLGNSWMLMNPTTKVYRDTQLDALACQKILEIVTNYRVATKKMRDKLARIKMPELNIQYDMDNESPLIEGKEEE